MLPGELMVIKPDIPRKVCVLQKIDCQKEELWLWKTKYRKRL